MCNWAQTQRAHHVDSLNSRAVIICNILEIFIIFQPVLLSQAVLSGPRVELLSDYCVMSEICHKAITHTLALRRRKEALPWHVKTWLRVAANMQRSSTVQCLSVFSLATYYDIINSDLTSQSEVTGQVLLTNKFRLY